MDLENSKSLGSRQDKNSKEVEKNKELCKV